MTSMPTYCIFGYLRSAHEDELCRAALQTAETLGARRHESSGALNGTSMSMRPIVYLNCLNRTDAMAGPTSTAASDSETLQLPRPKLDLSQVSSHQVVHAALRAQHSPASMPLVKPFLVNHCSQAAPWSHLAAPGCRRSAASCSEQA